MKDFSTTPDSVKRIRTTILATCLLTLFPISTVSANLLVNGGAEDATTSPWLLGKKTGMPSGSENDAIKAVQAPKNHENQLSAFEGDWFFSFGEAQAFTAGNYYFMSQSGALPSTTGTLSLSGYFATEYDDFGTASLALFDSADNLLAQADSGPLNNNLNGQADYTWEAFNIHLAVPDTAATWTVTLTGEVQTGVWVNTYWDGISLNQVPEPGPVALLALGMFLAGIKAGYRT